MLYAVYVSGLLQVGETGTPVPQESSEPVSVALGEEEEEEVEHVEAIGFDMNTHLHSLAEKASAVSIHYPKHVHLLTCIIAKHQGSNDWKHSIYICLHLHVVSVMCSKTYLWMFMDYTIPSWSV